MRSNTHNSILTAAIAVAILIFCPALQATQTISLISAPYSYAGQSVGPYTMNISPTPGNLLAFCLDGNQIFHSDTGSLGSSASSVNANLTAVQEDEVALLASWSLAQDPGHTNINGVEGPIQLAIWYVMNTLPSGVVVDATHNTPAWSFVTQAQTHYGAHTSFFNNTPGSFMSSVQIWTPTNWVHYTAGMAVSAENQRFITFTPEPGTMIFLGTGVVLMALSRIRRRR